MQFCLFLKTEMFTPKDVENTLSLSSRWPDYAAFVKMPNIITYEEMYLKSCQDSWTNRMNFICSALHAGEHGFIIAESKNIFDISAALFTIENDQQMSITKFNYTRILNNRDKQLPFRQCLAKYADRMFSYSDCYSNLHPCACNVFWHLFNNIVYISMHAKESFCPKPLVYFTSGALGDIFTRLLGEEALNEIYCADLEKYISSMKNFRLQV